MGFSMRGIIFLLPFLAACGDRDLDEYQRERESEEISKVTSISGVYEGEILRTVDEASLGHLVLDLQPDVRINLNPDKVNAQRQVVLKGNLELRDQKSKFISFSNAFFDSESNIFQAVITQSTAGGNLSLDLEGKWSGTTISGSLEVKGFPESRTIFKLEKSEGQMTKHVRVVGHESAKPEGTKTERWDAKKIQPSFNFGAKSYFQVRELDSSSDEEFFQTFAPLKYVDAIVTFTEGATAYFPSAVWDLRTGRLRGSTKIDVSGMSRTLVLDCISILDASSKLGWNCSYTNNSASSYFEFEFRKP